MFLKSRRARQNAAISALFTVLSAGSVLGGGALAVDAENDQEAVHDNNGGVVQRAVKSNDSNYEHMETVQHYTADGHFKHAGAALAVIFGLGLAGGAVFFGDRAGDWERKKRESEAERDLMNRIREARGFAPVPPEQLSNEA